MTRRNSNRAGPTELPEEPARGGGAEAGELPRRGRPAALVFPAVAFAACAAAGWWFAGRPAPVAQAGGGPGAGSAPAASVETRAEPIPGLGLDGGGVAETGDLLGSFAKLPIGFESFGTDRLSVTVKRIRGAGGRVAPAALFCREACWGGLARTDPDGAIALIEGRGRLEAWGLSRVLSDSRVDFARLVLLNLAARSGAGERAAVVGILTALSESDVAGIARRLPMAAGALEKHHLLLVVTTAAGIDAAAAFGQFLTDGNPGGGALAEIDRSEVLHALYTGWAEQDAAAALRHAQQSGDLAGEEGLGGYLVGRLVAQDADAALEFLRSVQAGDPAVDKREVRGMLGDALGRLARSDPDRAFEFARQEIARPEWRQHALRTTVGAVAGLGDPRRALEMLDSGEFTSSETPDLVNRIGAGWNERDRDAAMEWALSLGGGDRGHAIEGAMMNASADELAGWVQRLLGSGEREVAETLVRGHLGHRTGVPLLELDPPLPPELNRMVLASEVAFAAERGDPDAVPGLLARLEDAGTGDDPSLGGQLPAAISKWAEFDPVAAARWAESTTFGEDVRNEAFYNVVNAWAYHDTAAASEWLAGRPESPARDAGAVALAERIVLQDPEAALAWVAGVSDDGRREGFFRDHVGPLNRFAPEATRALVAEGVFGDRAQEQLDGDAAWREAFAEVAAGLGE